MFKRKSQRQSGEPQAQQLQLQHQEMLKKMDALQQQMNDISTHVTKLHAEFNTRTTELDEKLAQMNSCLEVLLMPPPLPPHPPTTEFSLKDSLKNFIPFSE
jgi:hypothetical protein